MVHWLATRPPSPASVSTLDQAIDLDQIPTQNTDADSDLLSLAMTPDPAPILEPNQTID